jgi:hypothetical protein
LLHKLGRFAKEKHVFILTERNFCAAKRDAENRGRDLDELRSTSEAAKEKADKKVRILADENRRLRGCIKDKEAQIRESEARAKSLLLKVTTFSIQSGANFKKA